MYESLLLLSYWCNILPQKNVPENKRVVTFVSDGTMTQLHSSARTYSWPRSILFLISHVLFVFDIMAVLVMPVN
jgi:hypothetical protein